jgi:hypothetical protein
MNIEEFRMIEKIKLSYLKHRGNIEDISKDLAIDVAYIRKMVGKFKKKEDRDVSTLIANNLMAHVMLGSQSRTVRLMELLKTVEGSEKPILSVCCQAPFDVIEDSYENRYVCQKCDRSCDIHYFIKPAVYNIISNLIEQLREEDVALIEMADKMGYTNVQKVPDTLIQQNNRILVLNDNEKEAFRDLKALPPLDREKIIDKIGKILIQDKRKKIEDGTE